MLYLPFLILPGIYVHYYVPFIVHYLSVYDFERLPSIAAASGKAIFSVHL
jgi:hypothetical protein